MNYDQLLSFVAGVYKIPGKSLDALQGSFLLTFAASGTAVFLGFLLTLEPAPAFLSGIANYLSIAFYVLAFLLTIPFQMTSINVALYDKEPITHSETPSGLSTYLIFGGAVLGMSLLALLPYITAYKLVLIDMETINSTSNILLAIRLFLLIGGLTAIVYTACKLAGTLVVSQTGQQPDLFKMFSNSQGHFLAILVIGLATIIPVELATQFIIHSLSGLMNIADSVILDTAVIALQAFVRASVMLLQLYYLWTALTIYMKKENLA